MHPFSRLTCVALLAASCTGREAGHEAGPAVTPLDSVVLAEPDSLETFLALRTQALTPGGELLLETGTQILQFEASGALARVLGRPGHGPGEFVRISSIGLLPGDSLVAAVDARRARIVVFGLSDGALRREVSLAVPFYPDQQWVVRGDSVIMPGKLRREPFTTWITSTDSVRSWGTAPAIYDRSMQAYSQGGEPSLAPHGGGWVALFPADPALYELDASGQPSRSTVIPSRRRVGVPSDVADQVATIAAADSFRFAASLVLAVRQLSTGTYLLVHVDADPEKVRSIHDPGSGGHGISYRNVRYWVSLVSADLSRACVDGRVPLDVDNILSPFFRADTLYFVARRLAAGDRLRSVLYSFRVDDVDCDWLPTAPHN